jgi:hypothetical protein
MSSLPLISHRLFVAAIKEENGLPPKQPPGQTLLELPETMTLVSGRSIQGETPPPGAAPGVLPARAGTFGY